MTTATQRRIEDARYTLESLARDLCSRMDARTYISADDWDAYDRAEQAVKDVESLWSDWDGVLIPYAQQRQYRLGDGMA